MYTPKSKNRVWAEINTDALKSNIAVIRECAGDKEIIAIVKANAYGHGTDLIVPQLLKYGITKFGIATVDEGLNIKKLAPEAMVMMLGHSHRAHYSAFLDSGYGALVPAVCSSEAADALNEYAKQSRISVICNIKVNTGMNRVGLSGDEELKHVLNLRYLSPHSVFTHFSCADSAAPENMEYAKRQQEKFEHFAEIVHSIRDNVRLHSQNSAAAIMHREFGDTVHMDYVRTGIAMYGCCPAGHGTAAAFLRADAPVTGECEMCGAWGSKTGKCRLRQVMSVRTHLAQFRTLPAGSEISYGRTYKTTAEEKIGMITAGYADGFTRRLSGTGYSVLLRGQAVPLRGRISMDQSIIHATDDCEIGDYVTLFSGESPETHFDTAAAKTGTISYEMMCGISQRVVRVATTDNVKY